MKGILETERFDGNTAIKADINALTAHIREYRVIINGEAVWLFLATLGCWGVSGTLPQFVALCITLVLFLRQATDKVSDKRSFAKMIQDVRDRIDSELLEADARKARLYDLLDIQKTELATIVSIKRTWVFVVCWAFYILSCWHALKVW